MNFTREGMWYFLCTHILVKWICIVMETKPIVPNAFVKYWKVVNWSKGLYTGFTKAAWPGYVFIRQCTYISMPSLILHGFGYLTAEHRSSDDTIYILFELLSAIFMCCVYLGLMQSIHRLLVYIWVTVIKKRHSQDVV